MVSRFAGLCYHYIRPDSGDEFPRILGTKAREFEAHLDALEATFRFIAPSDVAAYLNAEGNGEGILVTFDDGLSDHYRAAKILTHRGIQAIFFIPTCIVEDNLPANPVILHFAFARYGARKVADTVSTEGNMLGIEIPRTLVERDFDPWKTINAIKYHINHELPPESARDLLLRIYKRLLLADDPHIFGKMHLVDTQILEMIAGGHTIGAHSHSHASLANLTPNDARIEGEIRMPKTHLEHRFNREVDSYSFPYGLPKDCVAPDTLSRIAPYRFAYTLGYHWNGVGTPAQALGRINVMSQDSPADLVSKVRALPSL